MRAIAAIVFAVHLAGCATAASDERLPRVRPPSPAEVDMGYQEAVDMGTQYVTQQGYPGSQLEVAERVQPNIWRVRFGLAPKGSGKVLELYFDGTKRVLLKSIDERGVVASPAPNAPSP
jgi:hypothetical protein